MASKKQKERKKKIQERQTQMKTGSLEAAKSSSLQQRLSKLAAQHREASQEAASLRQSDVAQAKRILDLERKLRGQERTVAEMHNNHTAMRRSLVEIREMHLPIRYTNDIHESVPCRECDKRWPCPTYRRIKTPDHVVVSSLMEMERDLTNKEKQ